MDKTRYRRRRNMGWYKGEKCKRCFHRGEAHFWFDPMYGTGESVSGCSDCREEICQDRRPEQSMSAVNLCERCGALMLGKAVSYLTFSASREAKEETQELCPGCFGEFMDFMHSRSEPTAKTPYREPWKPAAGKSETLLMLENGPCGDRHTCEFEGDVMCMRPKGHAAPHRDGEVEWSA